MAHQITIRQDGFAEMAFTGSRNAIWHGLGQEITNEMSFDDWFKQAGLDWSIKESIVLFDPSETYPNPTVFSGKKALYRSDTNAPLSIVSEEYKVVQPKEVIEFFRSLIESHDMKLSTAGSLFGGTRFWALAETGKEFNVFDGVDKVIGNLLFVTAADGTLASLVKFVSTRVVCNNTMQIALNENSTSVSRQTHRGVFDQDKAKIDLGLIDAGWTNFKKSIDKLINTPLTDTQVRDFYKEQFTNKDKKETWGIERKVSQLMDLYYNGAGAEYGKGTAWGALNAITNLTTHGSGKRNLSHQFWSGYIESDKIRQKAMNSLLEYS